MAKERSSARTKGKDVVEFDFESSLAAVEQIVAKLESGELGLSESLDQLLKRGRFDLLLDGADSARQLDRVKTDEDTLRAADALLDTLRDSEVVERMLRIAAGLDDEMPAELKGLLRLAGPAALRSMIDEHRGALEGSMLGAVQDVVAGCGDGDIAQLISSVASGAGGTAQSAGRTRQAATRMAEIAERLGRQVAAYRVHDDGAATADEPA